MAKKKAAQAKAAKPKTAITTKSAASPPLPPDTPAVIRRIAGQLSAGIQIQHPLPHFPPGLTQALQSAKKAGIYQIAVWTADDKGRLTLHRTNSAGFLYNWQLRALKMLEKQILAMEPPGAVVNKDPAGAAE